MDRITVTYYGWKYRIRIVEDGISQRNFCFIAFYEIYNGPIGSIDDTPIFGDINVCQFLFFSWRMSEGEIDNIIADAAMIPCNRSPCTSKSIGFQIRKVD